jgi:hypothetical protein
MASSSAALFVSTLTRAVLANDSGNMKVTIVAVKTANKNTGIKTAMKTIGDALRG